MTGTVHQPSSRGLEFPWNAACSDSAQRLIQTRLIGISVQNNVIILYDNDAEGVSSFNRTVRLNVPDNMRILKLPDLAEFRDFETVGPSGAHRADINGRAAAIECYLDVGPTATVRWNNYHKELGAYHGELVDKGDVMRAFLPGAIRGEW